MKKFFEEPKIEVLKIQIEDIVTTSGIVEGDNDLPFVPAG